MESRIHFATKAVIFKDNKVLIVKKNDNEDVNPNTFDIPGGRLEFGEKPVDSLKREVREEVGLEVDVIRPSRVWSLVKDDKFQLVGVTFLCRYTSGNVALGDEHNSYIWVDMNDYEKNNLSPWIGEEISAAKEIA
tara:strand:+ start:768 stop:1172 length:405 start_codon:yes stop_codon:yes gene_type:complete